MATAVAWYDSGFTCTDQGPEGPPWRWCALLVEGERAAAGVAGRGPRGRSIQPPGAGAFMGPSMGPELGVSWGPDRAVNEVPLTPPNCGGILRNWAVQTGGSLIGKILGLQGLC